MTVIRPGETCWRTARAGRAAFLIDNEDEDPRQPTLTVGYNTEAQVRRSIQAASDQAEAR